jgi:hypothetical protein
MSQEEGVHERVFLVFSWNSTSLPLSSDSENHALLAVASLPTVEPHWIRAFHGELCLRKGSLFSATGILTSKSKLKLDVMANESYKPVSNLPGRGKHGVLSIDCITVWFFCFKDECDDIAGIGHLVIMMACKEAHNRKFYGPPITKGGLYWISPSGPPATTSQQRDGFLSKY